MSTTQPLILCVDDERVSRKVVERLLTNHGYRVLTAENGEQALATLQSVTPHLILLDVMMPGMDGYEVCATLQQDKALAYIPVIFFTALEKEQDKARAFALGAADYLTKPVHKQELLDKVAFHIKTNLRWQGFRQKAPSKPTVLPSDFLRFKTFLAQRLPASAKTQKTLSALTPSSLYTMSAELDMDHGQIARAIAEFSSLPHLPTLNPEDVVLGVLPPPFCKANAVVAITPPTGDGPAFALSNPFLWDLLQTLKKCSNQAALPTLFVTEPKHIAALFEEERSVSTKELSLPSALLPSAAKQHQLEQQKKEAITLGEDASEASGPIISLVNQLIEHAYAMGASDIHIEPQEREVVIRYRLDGVLRVIDRLPHPGLIRPLVTRLKVMSGLDIVERRLPQDGRIVFKKFSGNDADFDLRVATAPMQFGEKVVMRILDKRKTILPLPALGFSPRHLEMYRDKIKTPHGLILHVGPTGSGKSMTLYAALNEIRSPDLNIQTIEDPIEYTLPDINQLQVHREIGLTFSRVLRSYLRQDPDIILVGEIRDRETAETAIEAALTGHLLLSTLHTNDAASTIIRLLEIGVEPFMVSSSLILVCAQRLLRRLCPHCKKAYAPDAEEKRLVGGVAPSTDLTLYRSKGCRQCNGTGYKGRIGVHELIVLDDTLRKTINKKGVTAEEIKRQAVEDCGTTTLYWDAMEKVRAGLCSLEDALSEVSKDEFDSRPQWMFQELELTR